MSIWCRSGVDWPAWLAQPASWPPSESAVSFSAPPKTKRRHTCISAAPVSKTSHDANIAKTKPIRMKNDRFGPFFFPGAKPRKFTTNCHVIVEVLGPFWVFFWVVFDSFWSFFGIRKYRRRSPKRSKWDSKISSAEPKA